MKKEKNLFRMLGNLTTIITFCLLITIPFQSAFGADETRLKFKPAMKVGAEFNDNIYLANESEQDDTIITIEPEIALLYRGSPGNGFSLGYDMKLATYVDKDNNNYQTHSPFVTLDFRTPGGFYLNLSEKYTYTADPYGTENHYGEGKKTKRWNNDFEAALGYEFFKKFGIEGTYRNQLARFKEEEDKWQNKIDHRVGIGLHYNITPKTSLLTEFRYTTAEYDEQGDGILGWSGSTSQDYTLLDYLFGVRFKPGAKLDGEILVGFGQKEFDNSKDKFGRDYVDQDTWIVETEVGYQPSRKIELTGTFSRAIKGSPDNDSSSYYDTLIGIGGSFHFTERLSSQASVDWNWLDYSDEDISPEKYFHIYGLKLGVDWKIIKWLSCGAEYSFKKKSASDSQYEVQEYTNNIFGVYVNADF